MTIDRGLSVGLLLEFAKPYLNDDAMTEICVNRPGELWAERAGIWESHAIPGIELADLNALATAIAAFSDTDVSDVRPILSAILPSGERIQVVKPPACEQGSVSITIRKPSRTAFTLDTYQATGFFNAVKPADEASGNEQALMRLQRDGDWQAFMALAVVSGKTIVVAGETNSGKTTFMRTLIDLIPADKRLITIEDVHELEISHPNRVHLFYEPDGVTPTQCLRSCLRMNPDRIILGEVRGGEAMDLLNVAASGHSGTITSVHAGSCSLALERLALMAMQSEQGRALPYEAVTRLIKSVVDIVVHVTNGAHGRHITDVLYTQVSA